MTDHFATLDEPRRPWLDEEALKARFHALTSAHHPDVAGENAPDFSALNVAYQTLREPRTRLRHLLELEAPSTQGRHQPAPAAIDRLFSAMGTRKQALDEFLKKRAAAPNPLAKALLMSEQLTLQEDLEAWLGELEAERTLGLDRLPELDAAWRAAEAAPADRAAIIPELAELAQSLGYLDKWIAQIREALVKLQIEF